MSDLHICDNVYTVGVKYGFCGANSQCIVSGRLLSTTQSSKEYFNVMEDIGFAVIKFMPAECSFPMITQKPCASHCMMIYWYSISIDDKTHLQPRPASVSIPGTLRLLLPDTRRRLHVSPQSASTKDVPLVIHV